MNTPLDQDSPKTLFRLRAVGAIAMVLVLVASIATWMFTRDRLPSEITLATASSGGLYHSLGALYGEQLSSATARRVHVMETAGSVENASMLRSGGADLAIVQGGPELSNRLSVLTPLYDEVVHIIVRRESGILTIEGLRGRAVALGPQGSGTRDAATEILTHYSIDAKELTNTDGHFSALETDPELEAAFATTGFLNPSLRRLLATGEFQLLDIDQAEAFALLHTHFQVTEIPKGIYGGRGTCPAFPTASVATRAYLVAGPKAPDLLVSKSLDALYGGTLGDDFPILIPKSKAADDSAVALHPEAARYFDPYGGIDLIASFMESLAAGKELLLALGAGVFLVWDRCRRAREREAEVHVKQQKERLDDFLEQTLVIERAQLDTDDLEVLNKHLEEVTRIKLQALEELTHEDLRGDQMFQIFLMQCANLIRKIQARM